MRTLKNSIVLAVIASLQAVPALAQQWPTKSITWVVPFAAGGPMDVVSRPVAKKMAEILNTPIVVENKPGAGGAMGIDAISRSRPDGYTIGIGSIGTQAIVPNISKSIKYDPIASFSNIGLLGKYTNVLLVNENSQIRSVADLTAAARKEGANVTFGSAGNGSSNHLSGELLRAITGAKMTHIPYRGSAPALTDLLAGNITFMFDTLNTTMTRIQGGSLRPLAVTSPKRSPFLPNVPTMDEAGISGYSSTGGELWWGVVGPAGISQEVVVRLNKALSEALHSPEVSEQLKNQYVEIWSSTPEAFSKVVEGSYRNWKKVVQDAKLEESP
ncbi:Bug family tripartite tricarboxylate transporter substrate binding protein [Alicycliphilus denitrificans]|uniref:Bug family tripartite tricarboxylate transporter substrate binding protein n=1 Tax=Alicycliphilus denitrificans TaxID=179636 RepID=UPI003A80A8A1